MKRLSNSAAAKTPTDNTKDVLQAIPLDVFLAPALLAYAARIRAWASSRKPQEARGAELADLRRSHIRVAG